MMTNDLKNLENLINICNLNLRSSPQHIDYLKSRDISRSYIEKYKIGFFPQNIDTLKKHVSREMLLRLNIVNFSNNSDFSDYFSLIFPIYNEYGNPVGISGRALMSDEERSFLGVPKYKNSSYKKSKVLFGLNFAKDSIIKNNNVYVVEGYFDKIAMDKYGLDNCVAICGTSYSSRHFLTLIKYTNSLTFLLDSDSAGKSSMERIYSKFSNKGIKLRFLELESKYKDIDNFFEENSLDDFYKINKIIPGSW